MPITWIEVADTAVKIGLGATITGLSAYVLAGRNHSHTLARDLTSRRVSILEEACADVEEYFSYCTHLYNVIGTYTMRNHVELREQTNDEKLLVVELHKDFQNALNARNKVRAKLALLGATDALENLMRFNQVLGRYRKVVGHDAKIPTAQQHSEFTAEFQKYKNAFYAAAAEFLRTVGSGRGV
jgi:hypothetical protein